MKDDIGYEAKEIDGYRGATEVTIHKTLQPGLVAITAIEFVERWGMVTGMPDGEDSAGRHQLRLATPDEVVERALEISQKLWDAFEEKGLLLEGIPIPKESIVVKDAG